MFNIAAGKLASQRGVARRYLSTWSSQAPFPFNGPEDPVSSLAQLILHSSSGELSKVRIWHDNKFLGASWFLESVEIIDETSKKNYMFPCSRWLSKDKDDKSLVRELPCVNRRASLGTTTGKLHIGLARLKLHTCLIEMLPTLFRWSILNWCIDCVLTRVMDAVRETVADVPRTPRKYAFLSVGRSVGRGGSWLIMRLVVWLAGWLAGLIDQSIDWWMDGFIDWLIDLSVGW